MSLLSGEISEQYQSTGNDKYPGRYGSVAFGLYNGAGYHALEKNKTKMVAARLTLRPLPDRVPGLQISYYGIAGKGNTDPAPDWTVNTAFISYESRYVMVTGT